MLGRRDVMLGTLGLGLAAAAGPRGLHAGEREAAQAFDSFGLVPGGGVDRGERIGGSDLGPDVVAVALDRAHGASAHRDALAAADAALADPTSTPSARILWKMSQAYEDSYVRFGLAHSAGYRNDLLELPLDPATEARYRRMAEESLAEQRKIEIADVMPFEAFRQQYLAQDLLGRIRPD